MFRSFSGLLACLVVGWLLALSGCSKSPEPADPKPSDAGQPEKRLTTAQAVLDEMGAAYKAAASYADFGRVRLIAETKGGQIDLTADFSVKLVRPNKLHVEANQGVIVTDGQHWDAWIRNLPDQYVTRDVPVKLTMDAIFADRVFYQALTRGFTGQIPQLTLIAPQLVLLLLDDSLKQMLAGAEEKTLVEPGRIGDIECYRVQVRWPDGIAVFWIDQKSFVLRRMVFPTNHLWQILGGDAQVQSLSLIADFEGAQLGGSVDPKAFAFEAAKGAQQVKQFVPPDMFQLMGKKAPEFKFVDLQGKAVTSQSLAGKAVLLDFWGTTCEPSRGMLPEIEKLYQKYKDNGKLAMFAVSLDPAEVDNKAVEGCLKEWKVTIPILRDPDQNAAKSLRVLRSPTIILLGANGVVERCDMDDDPALVASLPARLEKMAAGEDFSKESVAELQEQLKADHKRVDDIFQGKVPEEAKPAERSSPKTFKLVPLWKAADVKSPGNILVVSKPGRAPRIFVIDEWKTVVEVGTDGRTIATCKPEFQGQEMICNLRTAAGADGKRVFAAFAPVGRQFFCFDENWKQILAFPDEAVKSTHKGIADVELGDLDGDGVLKAYVGYYDATGVQGVSLDGKRLWSNRSLLSVVRTAFTPPDAKGRRNLLCAYQNESGAMALLDAKGEKKGDVAVHNWRIGSILGADLKGDGQMLWCGLSVNPEGQTVMLGLTLQGDVLWNYPLPKGNPQQPIEPIIPGRITSEGPGQWILPGCDGSIHVVSADGKPIDRFNYGAIIGGLATLDLDGKPVLLISSESGLEALRVESQ